MVSGVTGRHGHSARTPVMAASSHVSEYVRMRMELNTARVVLGTQKDTRTAAYRNVQVLKTELRLDIRYIHY